jgi:hypothetical protein
MLTAACGGYRWLVIILPSIAMPYLGSLATGSLEACVSPATLSPHLVHPKTFPCEKFMMSFQTLINLRGLQLCFNQMINKNFSGAFATVL